MIKVESRERGCERLSLGVTRMRRGVQEPVPTARYRERNKRAVNPGAETPGALGAN